MCQFLVISITNLLIKMFYFLYNKNSLIVNYRCIFLRNFSGKYILKSDILDCKCKSLRVRNLIYLIMKIWRGQVDKFWLHFPWRIIFYYDKIDAVIFFFFFWHFRTQLRMGTSNNLTFTYHRQDYVTFVYLHRDFIKVSRLIHVHLLLSINSIIRYNIA